MIDQLFYELVYHFSRKKSSPQNGGTHLYLFPRPHPQNSLMRYSTFTLGLWNFWEYVQTRAKVDDSFYKHPGSAPGLLPFWICRPRADLSAKPVPRTTSRKHFTNLVCDVISSVGRSRNVRLPVGSSWNVWCSTSNKEHLLTPEMPWRNGRELTGNEVLEAVNGADKNRFVCSNQKHQCKLTTTIFEMITLKVIWSRSTKEVSRNWKAMMTEFWFSLWRDLCAAGFSFGCMLQMQIVLTRCWRKTQEVTAR